MKFRKIPVEVEATQWFQHGDHPMVKEPTHGQRLRGVPSNCGVIKTLEDKEEGMHIVDPGDWIITGVHGEHYPCKPDIFKKTYEKVEA